MTLQFFVKAAVQGIVASVSAAYFMKFAKERGLLVGLEGNRAQ